MAAMLLKTLLDVGQVAHTGIVVRDLGATMDSYWRTLGIGPWKGYTSPSPSARTSYRGRACSYRAGVAVANIGAASLHLIQPLEGESTYSEFLESRGEGVHHIAFLVANLEEALRPFVKQGIGVLQSMDATGVKGAGRLAYLDSEEQFGTILELIQPPSEPVFEWIYPR